VRYSPVNVTLWVATGWLSGGLRTWSLAGQRNLSTAVIDALVAIIGAMSVAWFVWPLHGELIGFGISPSGVLWALYGAFFSLCLRQVFTP